MEHCKLDSCDKSGQVSSIHFQGVPAQTILLQNLHSDNSDMCTCRHVARENSPAYDICLLVSSSFNLHEPYFLIAHLCIQLQSQLFHLSILTQPKLSL